MLALEIFNTYLSTNPNHCDEISQVLKIAQYQLSNPSDPDKFQHAAQKLIDEITEKINSSDQSSNQILQQMAWFIISISSPSMPLDLITLTNTVSQITPGKSPLDVKQTIVKIIYNWYKN